MYEMMKAEFATLLSEKYSVDEMQGILMDLNIVAENYDIKKKETSLVVWSNEIPSLVKEYIVVKKIEGLSLLTLDQYTLYLTKFFDECRKSPEEVVKNDIVLFLHRYKMCRNISDQTLDKIREYICRFFNWACDEGYIERSPARTIKPIKHETKEREPLTRLELEYVRHACASLRDTAMVELFCATGMRVSEMVILKKSDIDMETLAIKLFGKGKKHRTTYINARAKVALMEYWMSRSDDNEYAFVTERATRQMTKDSIERAVRLIKNRSGITKKLTPHIFRHTYATHCLENGMDVEVIQATLGHASINTTMIYAKASKERIRTQHQKYAI